MLAATASPLLVAAILLVPSLGLAALGLMADAPGEWGRGALLAWTVLAAAMLAGTGLAAGGGVLGWLVLATGFAALMTGGPPGLALAAVSVLLVAAEAGLPGPRWLPVALAVAPALLAARHYVA
jgi:hypothetical protein